MAMILQKYKTKKKLGKGAYGDVIMVQDPNGKEYAIKMIQNKIIQKDPYLQQYLEGQKDAMMSIKNRNIVELYAFEQDKNYKYFVCQYCDGGDLLNYQAKQPNKVFDLKLATQILSQVIQGLEEVHHKGYLHRDIKPQNILLKKQGDNKYVYKLADFGFAKKSEDVGGTVLGTENYMSPEIFSNQIYGFQVDMWAFGVLFYFMLNMEFPFRVNPHAQLQQKRQQLIKQGGNFNYTQQIKKSKKKIMDNCTDQVNDLFKKMFNPDGTKRISFVEIRQHPLFREYFPVIQHQSRILYKSKKLNRLDSFLQQRNSRIQPTLKNKQGINKQNNKFNDYQVGKTKGNQQKLTIQAEFDRIQFLQQSAQILTKQLNFIDRAQISAFKYNLLKYYVVLMRQFYYSLKLENLQKRYPSMKWKQFTKTQQFNMIKQQAQKSLDNGQSKVLLSYDQCKGIVQQIASFNPAFQQNLQEEVKSQDFSGPLKQSYRASAGRIYEKVRQKFSTGDKYVYLTALVAIIYGFNHIINCSENDLRKIFADFNNDANRQNLPVKLSEVKSWMATTTKQKLKNVIKTILNTFFG